MTTEKKLLMLDIASDMISSIHTDLCAGTEEERKLADCTMSTIRSIFRLSKKLEALQKKEKEADYGKWIFKGAKNIIYCSLCDYFYKVKLDEGVEYLSFCPKCGKPMHGGDAE